MATTDTTVDTLYQHRIAMMQERGFDTEEAMALCDATKTVVKRTAHRIYEYEVAVTWHDVAKLQEAGATNEQVLAILT